MKTKRINLEGNIVDSRWIDCYLIVKTKGFLEVQEFARQINKVRREIARADIILERENERLKGANDSDFTTTLESIDKIEDQKEEASMKIFAEMLKLVKENFVSGIIFDESTNANREAKVEDIDTMDSEMINTIANAILGDISKKG